MHDLTDTPSSTRDDAPYAPSRRRLAWATEVGLLGLAALSLVGGLAWVLGPSGLDMAPLYRMGEAVSTSDANTVPHETVLVDGPAGVATVAAANRVTGALGDLGPDGGAVPGAAEFYGNTTSLGLWTLSPPQTLAWSGVRGLPLLGLAVVWLLLARCLRDVRRGEGFSTAVARRLGVVGVLVLAGVPATAVLRWVVARWVVGASNASEIARVPGLHLDFWPLAVGLVLLVVASLWQQAARMRADLEGLV